LDDAAAVQIRSIVEDAAASRHEPGSDEQKVGDLYRSFMDEEHLEKLGGQPLQPAFARIDALKSKADLPVLMAQLIREGVNVPLVPFVHQDNKESTRYIGDFFQGGLGLPDRDYYLQDDAKFKDIRIQYQAHVEKMLTLAGLKNAPDSAK